MNCPYCDNEIVDEDATFCPKCGKPLTLEEDEEQQNVVEVPQKQTDFVLAAAILTMISASFVASLGYLGVYQHIALTEYYDFSLIVGFLIFGIDGIITAAFAVIGATFMLKRKLFKFTMLGTVFPLVSVVVTFLCVTSYKYGFTDTLLFAEVSAAMLSVMSILLNYSARKEYS